MLLVLGILACDQADPLPPADSAWTAALFAISEEARLELDLAVPAAHALRADLQQLLTRARDRVGKKTGRQAIAALAQFLFKEESFRRELTDKGLQTSLLPWVLQQRRGSCLGLAGLYLVLAEALGLPLQGALLPGHFFLRYQASDGKRLNIELLKQGQLRELAWYQDRYPIPENVSAYLRPLSAAEIQSLFRFNLANAYRQGKKYRQAARNYQAVIKQFPDFAEAHANLGLVFQLLSQPRRAQAAYQKAQNLQPDLPGLQANIQSFTN